MIAGDATATSAAERAGDVLELRRAVGNPAVEHRPDLPRGARLVPPAARALPELLGRQAPRQRRPQESHGLRDGQALPLHASGLGAGDHADLPLSDRSGGEGFSLASGGQFSAHADFVNAWRPGELERLVDELPERARALRPRGEELEELDRPARSGRAGAPHRMRRRCSAGRRLDSAMDAVRLREMAPRGRDPRASAHCLLPDDALQVRGSLMR